MMLMHHVLLLTESQNAVSSLNELLHSQQHHGAASRVILKHRGYFDAKGFAKIPYITILYLAVKCCEPVSAWGTERKSFASMPLRSGTSRNQP